MSDVSDEGGPESSEDAKRSIWQRCQGWVDRHGGLWSAVQAAGVIGAAMWALIMLYQASIDGKIENAFAYASEFSEGRSGDARHLLDRLWYSKPEAALSLRVAVGQMSDRDDEARTSVIRQFVDKAILPGNAENGPVDVRLAIADIADSLDQITICATSCRGVMCWRGAQCDLETTRRLFCGYSRSFHLLYGDVLEDLRTIYGNRELGVVSANFAEEPECAP